MLPPFTRSRIVHSQSKPMGHFGGGASLPPESAALMVATVRCQCRSLSSDFSLKDQGISANPYSTIERNFPYADNDRPFVGIK